MIETKTSVSFVELHPGIRWACDVISSLWAREKAGRPVLTALGDSTHSPGSLHYGKPGDARCRALDIRTAGMKPEKVSSVVIELKVFLGPCFDVIIEADHVHVEIDAKHDGLEGL